MTYDRQCIACRGLFAATPALAQNNDTAATTMPSPTTRRYATDTNAAAPADATPDGDAAGATETTPMDTNTAEPAPAPKTGFPWGVLGLLGLIGLIPRTGGRKRG